MKEIIDEKNNKIIGNINLDNSKVKFTGSNNILYINDEITLVNSSIDFRGDNSLVYLYIAVRNRGEKKQRFQAYPLRIKKFRV